jgi:type I restriction enzyme S subunit
MSSDLPQGWRATKLDSVVERITKGTTPTSYGFEFLSKGIAFVKIENLRDGFIDRSSIRHFISEEAHQNQKRSILREGDILFSIAGTIGATCIVRKEDLPANTNQALSIIRGTSPVLLPNFLQRQLESEVAINQARAKERGGGMNNISLQDMREMRVMIAPLNEQQRIVAKLERLLAQVDTCQTRLARIPALLKRFRQSVLAAACSGRLTVDWRGNDDSVDEGVPRGWEQKALNSIFTVRTGGTPSRQIPAYFEKGTIPWIKTSEVQNCDIMQTEEFITERAARESNAKVFPTGTLLVAMYGEGKTRGQIGRLTFPAATNQACAALINTNLPQASNRYVFYYLLSQYYALRAQSVGGNQPNLNLGIIKDWHIPLPPLPEQQEIVRRVEKLFALADRIEARFAEGRKRVASIAQAILAKAFRGELVPTEFELAKAEGRSFESAEELLSRIRTASDARLNGNGSKPRKHRSQSK